MEKLAKNLLEFIDKSPTGFHVVENVKNILCESCKELKQNEVWQLEFGKSYYVTNENQSLVAFTLDEDIERGFNITASHIDSPCIKIKPNSQVLNNNHYISLNIEMYGGAILSTWFDRGLSIAGQVVFKQNGKIVSKLIDFKRILLTIPSIAIHLVRDKKEVSEINPQTQMKPVLGFVESELSKEECLLNLIKSELNCEVSDILDFELYLYACEKGEIIGLNNEFIHSKYLDDLLMVYTSTLAFDSSETNKSKVLVLTNNEEVGSESATGADSVFFENVLERIYLSLNKTREHFFMGISNSISVSGDLAHGYHPNYTDRSDETNKPLLGKGITFKYSASKRYSTESLNSAKLKDELSKRNIPYQTYVNRSDIRGGSTIGPILSKKLGISSIDLGPAILGMHSVRELGATIDVKNTLDTLVCFYEMK